MSELCLLAAQFGLLVAGWEEMVLKVLVLLFSGAEGLKKVRILMVFTSCRTNGQFLSRSTTDLNLCVDERLTSL